MFGTKLIVPAVVATIGISLAAAPASASVITYDGSTVTGTTDFTDAASTVEQFNSNLGTLQSVTITIGDSFTSTLTVANNSSSASSGSAQTNVAVGFEDAGGLFTADQLIVSNGTAINAATTASTQPSKGLYNLAGGAHISFPGLTGSATPVSTNALTAANILAEFTGSGTIALDVSSLTTTSLTNTGGNTAASQVTTATVTDSVTYTYTPAKVPEPVSIALLGTGVLALGFLRRRFI